MAHPSKRDREGAFFSLYGLLAHFSYVTRSALFSLSIVGGSVQTSCPQMNGAFRFSLKAAARRTMTHPCTNVPTVCKKCFPQCCVWKYNLGAHWALRHSGDPIPAATNKQTKITEIEKKWVSHVGKGGRIPPAWNPAKKKTSNKKSSSKGS